jgi:hypothetical protein
MRGPFDGPAELRSAEEKKREMGRDQAARRLGILTKQA